MTKRSKPRAKKTKEEKAKPERFEVEVSPGVIEVHTREKCHACGQPVEKVQRRGSSKPTDWLAQWRDLKPEKPEVIERRIRQRIGRRTVVFIGTSPDSCGLAPFDEPGVKEIWCLNDAHHLPFLEPNMGRITRWFQLHQPWRFRRRNPRREIDHYAWLQQHHDFPIYMQRVYEDVPCSVAFPLRHVTQYNLVAKLGRGGAFMRKYYGCSFSYLMGLAYYEGFDRIEMYGVELAQQIEYIMQRPNTEFWAGIGVGKGVQIYVPERCRVFNGTFYPYRWPNVEQGRLEQKQGNGPEIPADAVDEDNVGQWPGYPDVFHMNLDATLEYPIGVGITDKIEVGATVNLAGDGDNGRDSPISSV